MPYRIRMDQNLEDEIKRIALEQIDRVLAEIDDEDLGVNETVHQVRKRCKKFRALIRLVRPGFEKTYRRENTAVRDAARLLSDARDARVMLETFENLRTHFPEETHEKRVGDLREALKEKALHLGAPESGSMDREIGHLRDALLEVREHIPEWEWEGNLEKSLWKGLKKTYKRGRKAMEKAWAEPSMKNFHEWRKRVKYHRYQVRMLRDVWCAETRVRRRALHDLTDVLGEEHDLAVLGEFLAKAGAPVSNSPACRLLDGLIATRRQDLQTGTRALGLRLYVEKPKKGLTRRFRGYWDASRRVDD